jgi:E3 ubiquitin-protein ligase TRIP12
MELYSKTRAVLELEYFGEVGTGLGPTLEFYTMLSHELQRESLGMWRHEEAPQADEQQAAADKAAGATAAAAAGSGKSAVAAASATAAMTGPAAAQQQVQLHQEVVSHEGSGSADEYVYAPHGLFPRPLAQEQRVAGNAVGEHFRLLGRSIARALQDNRLLDLPLNPVFFRAALGKPLDLYDISQVDPALGSSLEKLAQAAAAHAAAGGVGDVLVDGCQVEDLCLSFTLPGELVMAGIVRNCLLGKGRTQLWKKTTCHDFAEAFLCLCHRRCW